MESRARVRVLAAGALALLLWPGAARARLLLSQKEALALAFPAGAPQRKTAYLGAEQLEAARKAARAKVESAVWTYYVAGSSYAYFDTHSVRTMPETVMVVVGADGRVVSVELLAFAEPDDYLPSARWLSQFKGQALDHDLQVRRKIRNIAGATFTAESAAEAVRRVLAVHGVVHGKIVK